MSNSTCPIWGTDCSTFQTDTRIHGFHSPRAGGYFAISEEVKNCLEVYLKQPNFKQKFSLYVYDLQNKISLKNPKKDAVDNFITTKILELINNKSGLTFSEKKERFFKFCMSQKKT